MIQFQNTHITVFESALFRTTSTVLEFPDFLLLVDPNLLPLEIENIQNFARAKKKKICLFFTHSDYDHIIGYGAFPKAQVIASKAFAATKKRKAQLAAIHKFDDEFYLKRSYKAEYPIVDTEISTDYEIVRIGEEEMVFLLTPGHTADGAAVFSPFHRALVAGDYLSNIEFPFICHSKKDYGETLIKLMGFVHQNDVQILIPGHGDIAFGKEAMNKRIERDLNYLRLLESGSEMEIQRFLSEYSFKTWLQKEHRKNLKIKV